MIKINSLILAAREKKPLTKVFHTSYSQFIVILVIIIIWLLKCLKVNGITKLKLWDL